MRQIPEKIDSKFRFVLLASTRAEQIMRGAQSKVEQPGAKHTRLAQEEILGEAVAWDYGPAEDVPEDALGAEAGEAAAGETAKDGGTGAQGD